MASANSMQQQNMPIRPMTDRAILVNHQLVAARGIQYMPAGFAQGLPMGQEYTGHGLQVASRQGATGQKTICFRRYFGIRK